MYEKDAQGRRYRGCLGEPGTPRLAKCLLWHPQVSKDCNISPVVPAALDLALSPSYASFPVAGPRAQNFVATPLRIARQHYLLVTEITNK